MKDNNYKKGKIIDYDTSTKKFKISSDNNSL